MDKYYGNVCELDIIFNFQKAYFILDELLLAGEMQESSKKNVLRCISQQDSLEDMEVRFTTWQRLDHPAMIRPPSCFISSSCKISRYIPQRLTVSRIRSRMKGSPKSCDHYTVWSYCIYSSLWMLLEGGTAAMKLYDANATCWTAGKYGSRGESTQFWDALRDILA